MALVKCRECDHDVSTEATTCPNCGVSLENEVTDNSPQEEETKGFWESWYIQLKMWFCGGAILVALYIFSYLTGCNVISIFL